MKQFFVVVIAIFKTAQIVFSLIWLAACLLAAYGCYLYFGGHTHP